MEQQTDESRVLEDTEKLSQYDNALRKLLSEKIFLAWILKGCTEEFRDVDPKEIKERYIEGEPQVAEVALDDEFPTDPGSKTFPRITGMDTVSKSTHEGTVTYDIRFSAMTPVFGQPVTLGMKLIVDVEGQRDFYPGYPLVTRAVYYGGRMISSQKETEFTGSDYGGLKKVYSIWICLKPPKERRNTINVYQIDEHHIKGKFVEERRHYDKMTEIMVCLGGSEDRDYDGTLKLLDVLFSNASVDEKRQVLAGEYNIPMTEQISEEVSGVDSIGAGIFRDGVTQGRKETTIIIKAHNNGDSAEQISAKNDYPLGYVCDVIADYENA